MKFTCSIELDNAAFEGDDLPVELARILTELGTKIVSGEYNFPISLKDFNGNTVGSAKLTETEE